MWALVSYANTKIRSMCLFQLEKGPKTPSSIALYENIHLSHVSRALSELSSKGLVTCLTPEQQKNRIYDITASGKEVLTKIRKITGNEG